MTTRRRLPAPLLLGVVLCGGASTRMGTDKAWIGWPSDPLAARVAGALAGAGCDDVVLVGGDRRRPREAGLRWMPDDEPGAGPLGGLVSAAPLAAGGRLLVCACDLPWLTAAALGPLLTALEPEVDRAGSPRCDVAVFEVDGRAQWSVIALSPSAVSAATSAYRVGERSLRGALRGDGLHVARLRPADPVAISDVDVRADLPVDLRRSANDPSTPTLRGPRHRGD